MIKFTTPANLDGAKLTNELIAAGIKILSKNSATETGFAAPMLDGSGDLWLDIAAKDEAKAAEIVAAHVA
jgi:hypothetical protein